MYAVLIMSYLINEEDCSRTPAIEQDFHYLIFFLGKCIRTKEHQFKEIKLLEILKCLSNYLSISIRIAELLDEFGLLILLEETLFQGITLPAEKIIVVESLWKLSHVPKLYYKLASNSRIIKSMIFIFIEKIGISLFYKYFEDFKINRQTFKFKFFIQYRGEVTS